MSRVAIAGGCLIGLLVCAFVLCYRLLWVGGYDLSVAVDSAEPPAWVICRPYSTRERAERDLGTLLVAPKERLTDLTDATVADPYRGAPVTLHLWLDGSYSPVFGETGDPMLHHALLVIAEMPDGGRLGTVADLPDYRRSRAVTVPLR